MRQYLFTQHPFKQPQQTRMMLEGLGIGPNIHLMIYLHVNRIRLYTKSI